MSGVVSILARLELGDKVGQRDTEGVADLDNFHEVQSSLATLILADERLRLFEPLGHIRLSEASIHSDAAQKRRQPRAVAQEALSVHMGTLREPCRISQNRICSGT